MASLFDTIRLGAIQAPNRIIMAPLTRARATREHVPTEIMRIYYQQRASAGLIISEATAVSHQGMGWPHAPGIWSEEQMRAWAKITEVVHEAGGRIVSQLWHMGRLVHPSFRGGQSAVSASATTAPGRAHTYSGDQPYAQARALELEEIPGILDDYARAAERAMMAGFDGVQLHAANGYLIDQFLRDGTNLRTDSYGGVIQNRVRLLREVTQAIATVAGADRTSVRLSPNSGIQGCSDSNPEPLFVAAAKALEEIGIAFLELREPQMDSPYLKADVPPIAPAMRKEFSGAIVLNSDYTRESAQAALDLGVADAISFGRPFIANPDLPEKFARGLPIEDALEPTYYSQGAGGYIDYPAASARPEALGEITS